MEIWQIIISICAGLVTIFTLTEKIRGSKSFKKLDSALTDLQAISAEFSEFKENFGALQTDLTGLNDLQILQKDALLAMLRNDLYRCFRDNRNIGAWTDDDCQVQTTLHAVYRALKGGDQKEEEELWWERKRTWKIVTEVEYQRLLKKYNESIKQT